MLAYPGLFKAVYTPLPGRPVHSTTNSTSTTLQLLRAKTIDSYISITVYSNLLVCAAKLTEATCGKINWLTFRKGSRWTRTEIPLIESLASHLSWLALAWSDPVYLVGWLCPHWLHHLRKDHKWSLSWRQQFGANRCWHFLKNDGGDSLATSTPAVVCHPIK